MQESIEKYLQGKSVPVSAIEVVEQVLKIKTGNADTATMLLQGIVKDSSQIYITGAGMLALRSKAEPVQLAKQPVCLCMIVPARTPSFFSGAVLFCARFTDDKEESRITLSSHEFNGVNNNPVVELRFRQLVEMIGNCPLVFDGFGNQISTLRKVIAQTTGRRREVPVISLYRLTKRLYPGSAIQNAAQLSIVLGEKAYTDAAPELQFSAFIEQFKNIWLHCRNQGYAGIDDLINLQSGDKVKIDYKGYAFDELFLAGLPESAGVYVMKNAAGQVIYVGKSKNLRRRLHSYFLEMEEPGKKLEMIREQVYEINITLTGSELEALLLEQQLIEEYHPQINKQVTVHERDNRTAPLYERILLLPGVEPDMIRLYLIKPGRDYECIDYKTDGSGPEEFRRRAQLFFTGGATPDADKRLAILASWLCRNEEQVNSIDMRKYADLQQVEKLINDYAVSMQVDKRRIIHY
ncbi:MAG TPA: GIY-YIG nuclease family protein [bacterium]|nr:GIY-YIG nuclease family protein [bacterium]HPN45488.1 GIY-YIG nuclease family protein [bacterium]